MSSTSERSSGPWLAWQAGDDPTRLAAVLRDAHASFVADGLPGPAAGSGASRVRPVVLESWRRSRSNGVDPERPAIRVALTGADLDAHRREHALSPLMPIVRRLLVDGAEQGGLVVAVADDVGRLLWVEGDRGVRSAVEAAGFVEGASWSEQDVGTSAPGIVLATDHEVQVFAAEHFACAVQPWSCSAAPIRDPSGRVLGVLDITGGDGAASPHMLSLVRATVAAMEAELVLRQLRAGVVAERAAAPAVRAPRDAGRRRRATPSSAGVTGAYRLEVLGRSAGVLATSDLSLRHSEILVLLAAHPAGLSADGLAVRLHPGTLSDVTVRAEVSRLRRAVPDLLGGSRPYRLAVPLRTDADDVRDALARGDVHAAVVGYGGPLLPRSQAPGVVALREELDAEVRAAVEATDDVAAVLAWTRTPSGAQDWAAWDRLTGLLPAGSTAAARARARLRLLDLALG